MLFDVLTIFPQIIDGYSAESILGRAQKAGIIKINTHNFRDYTTDKHGHVDDRPYGGGPGMVLQIQPIYDCLLAIGVLPCLSPPLKGGVPVGRGGKKRVAKTKIIALDPAGKKFDQKMAKKFSKLDRLVLVCGRYEGFDARVYKLCDERISIGDYVLSGGELPALTIIEAVSRLIPGVLGNEESLKEETFNGNDKILISNVKSNPKSKIQKFDIGNLTFDISREYPQYTRPDNFMGMKVPKVLLSGNHEEIKKWRSSRVVSSLTNFTITKKLDNQINEIVRAQGFNSKSEFYRFAIFNYLNRLYPIQGISDNNFKDTINELTTTISKRLKGRKLPSLEKQLL